MDIDKKNKKRFTIDILTDLHTRFKMAAAGNQEAMQAVIIRCIEGYVEEFEAKKEK